MRMGSMALLIAIATAASSVGARERENRFTASGEMRIPTARELDRNDFLYPQNDFSTIDRLADGEMDRMDREIDRLVTTGICRGC